jgi:hypothetical protein
MEFTPRGGRGPAPQPVHPGTQTHVQSVSGRQKHINWAQRTVRIELFIVLVGSALLLAAVSLFAAFSGSGVNSEADKVSKGQYQAVFLNGGVTSGSVSYSTYFGHITKLNDKYAVLNDVYYLTDQSSSNAQAASSPQLTKLGCQQLHSPEDEMVINRSQIAFWENIKDSGKVVQAIKQFKQQNPNGPNCSQQSSSNSSSQTQTATPPPAATTPPAGSTGTTNH